jgi:predicted transcriptional regulator
MNGYRYLIERNRLLYELEDQVKKIQHLAEPEKRQRKAELEAAFDRKVARLYAEVAAEYPGERRKAARPLDEPH